MSTFPGAEAELDLAISDMGSEGREEEAKTVLARLPGVINAHLHELGALIRYQPEQITPESICDHLRNAGFDVTVFQDSDTGATGTVAY